jgi:hypothetical protein
MDIENNYKETLFQIEPENKKESKVFKNKKIMKVAKENLLKLTLDRLNGRSGEC